MYKEVYGANSVMLICGSDSQTIAKVKEQFPAAWNNENLDLAISSSTATERNEGDFGIYPLSPFYKICIINPENLSDYIGQITTNIAAVYKQIREPSIIFAEDFLGGNLDNQKNFLGKIQEKYEGFKHQSAEDSIA